MIRRGPEVALSLAALLMTHVCDCIGLCLTQRDWRPKLRTLIVSESLNRQCRHPVPSGEGLFWLSLTAQITSALNKDLIQGF